MSRMRRTAHCPEIHLSCSHREGCSGQPSGHVATVPTSTAQAGSSVREPVNTAQRGRMLQVHKRGQVGRGTQQGSGPLTSTATQGMSLCTSPELWQPGQPCPAPRQTSPALQDPISFRCTGHSTLSADDLQPRAAWCPEGPQEHWGSRGWGRGVLFQTTTWVTTRLPTDPRVVAGPTQTEGDCRYQVGMDSRLEGAPHPRPRPC